MTKSNLAQAVAVIIAQLRNKASTLATKAKQLSEEGYSVWASEDSSHAKGINEACQAIEAVLAAEENADILKE